MSTSDSRVGTFRGLGSDNSSVGGKLVSSNRSSSAVESACPVSGMISPADDGDSGASSTGVSGVSTVLSVSSSGSASGVSGSACSSDVLDSSLGRLGSCET